jgi:nucleoredoxin
VPVDVLATLGSTLRLPDGTTTAFPTKSVIGLYFSAHWCPPCRGFTPELCEKYTALKEKRKDFELVFVSSDRDVSSFEEYHKEMSFPALPFEMRKEKETLSNFFKVHTPTHTHPHTPTPTPTPGLRNPNAGFF